ncbi:hypothetical protein [Photobacterium kishitanii]|uniref:Uncharacterized protein n=1 Tax=Photobacterium kishitanii TaxID=318456 RepID=A0A2T3KLJ2_9GAMM|nr:hypothetical protein [Photobacterium kishitanii]PSV00523.1 hypothetical protein C9J27_05155 [Photobacterium kishitanii]
MLNTNDSLLLRVFDEIDASLIKKATCVSFDSREIHNRLLKYVSESDLKALGIDTLMNMTYKEVYDFCIWFDEKTNITVIYTYVGESFDDCEFSVMLSGTRVREVFPKKQKYNDGLEFSEVEALFKKAVSVLLK